MVPAKIAFDQTVWAAIWNSIYFVVLGFLRLESPTKIFDELKATFRPMLTVRNSSKSLLSVLTVFLLFLLFNFYYSDWITRVSFESDRVGFL